MKIDRIKYTREFTYHGISEWIGLEASIDEDENPTEKLLELRNKLVVTFNTAISGESEIGSIQNNNRDYLNKY